MSSAWSADARSGQRLARLWRNIEDVEHEADHAVEAGAGDGLDDAVEPERCLGALERRRADGLVGKELGDEIVDQPLVVTLEVGPLLGADGVDDVLRNSFLQGMARVPTRHIA